MPSSKENRDLVHVAASLEATSSLVHTLLNEIYDTVSEFARFKAELESLQVSVEKLTAVVSDGRGGPSLVTSLAVFKQQLDDLKEGEVAIRKDLGSLQVSYQNLSLQLARMEPQQTNDEISTSVIGGMIDKTEKRKFVAELFIGLVIAVVTFLVGYYFEKQ